MISLAVQTVHTSGINLESLAVILGGFAGVVTILLSFVSRRADKRDAQHDREMQELRGDITNAVNTLSEVLVAKLESKETVASINVRLARLEGAAGQAIDHAN